MPPAPASRSSLLIVFVVVVIVLGVTAVVLWWPASTTVNRATRNNATANGNVNDVPATNRANANAKPTIPDPTVTYADDEFGFSVKRPESWGVTKQESGEGENRIVNYTIGDGTTGITLVVVPSSLEGIVRESVAIDSETTKSINGLNAKVVQARSAKDGSALTLIFFSKDDTVFVLNGAPETVERIGGTFSF